MKEKALALAILPPLEKNLLPTRESMEMRSKQVLAPPIPYQEMRDEYFEQTVPSLWEFHPAFALFLLVWGISLWILLIRWVWGLFK